MIRATRKTVSHNDLPSLDCHESYRYYNNANKLRFLQRLSTYLAILPNCLVDQRGGGK